jgi:hypothetical protein
MNHTYDIEVDGVVLNVLVNGSEVVIHWENAQVNVLELANGDVSHLDPDGSGKTFGTMVLDVINKERLQSDKEEERLCFEAADEHTKLGQELNLPES